MRIRAKLAVWSVAYLHWLAGESQLVPPPRWCRLSDQSVWEASGAGSDFGVTPSISLRPSGHTITRSNVILLPNPPLDSDAVSVVGRTLPRSDAYAELFSIASFAKYSSPPTRSSEFRIISFRAAVTLLGAPFGLPAPALGPPLLPLTKGLDIDLLFCFFLIKPVPCCSKRPISSRLISGFRSNRSSFSGSSSISIVSSINLRTFSPVHPWCWPSIRPPHTPHLQTCRVQPLEQRLHGEGF